MPLPHHFKPFSLPRPGTENGTVAALIDQDGRQWKEDLFTVEEAALILKLPLSLRNVEDRIICHHDKKGVYTVKNGYWAARSVFRCTSVASSSTVPDWGNGNVWLKVWRVQIPPKICAFSWRVLRSKKVSLPDVCLCLF